MARQEDREPMVSHGCFACRQAFKLPAARGREPKTCPRCAGTLHWMGPYFGAPPRKDEEAWRVLQTLYAHGFRFYDPRELGGPDLPTRAREVAAFLRDNPEHPFRVAEPDGALVPQKKPRAPRPVTPRKREATRGRGGRR